MKTIDTLEIVDGWVESFPGLLFQNEIKTNASENYETSLLFVANNQPNSFIKKVFDPPIGSEDYKEIRIYTKVGKPYETIPLPFYKIEDFDFKIKLNDDEEFEYYLPATKEMNSYFFKIPSGLIVSEIKIIAITDKLRFLYLSNLMFANDDNIFNDIIYTLTEKIMSLIPVYSCGVASCTGSTITFVDAPKYLNDKSLIKVDGEMYYIKSVFGKTVELKSNATFTNKEVFLFIPARLYASHESQIFPIVTIFDFPGKFVEQRPGVRQERGSFKMDSTVIYKQYEEAKSSDMQISVEGFLTDMNRTIYDIILKFLQQNKFWVDARGIDFSEIDGDMEIPADVSIVPQMTIQFTMKYNGGLEWEDLSKLVTTTIIPEVVPN